MESSGKSFADALKMVMERSSPEELIKWIPSEESVAARFVPSLMILTLNALAVCPNEITSLENVPDNLRLRLINRMCDRSTMNAAVLRLLVERSPTEIRLKNCSWLTQEQFHDTIGNCDTTKLQVNFITSSSALLVVWLN
ncbi:uncharacterized protein LOC125211314 [Salvia hispanica]|uniref:uncharacterized protein LOC125211314 n=1 Tax=Salvia hispanica TaxID=49212 RepID=UPI002009D5EB|nr:uncharacterized protein LOC125211314 [Salvia hispanica]